MPTYFCELCNFSTKLKGNFNQHKNTKKHRLKLIASQEKMSGDGVKNTNEHKMNTNEHKMNTNEHKMNTKNNQKSFKCDFCQTLFNTNASKRRHERHYCKLNPDYVESIINAKNTQIKTLEKDKEELENFQRKIREGKRGII